MGENHFAALPVALYAFDLMMCAIAFVILQLRIIATHGRGDSALAHAVGADLKGKISLSCYVLAIPLAFSFPLIAGGLMVLVALMWFVPDRRIEKVISE
jgi:uncharacterized membrane protein